MANNVPNTNQNTPSESAPTTQMLLTGRRQILTSEEYVTPQNIKAVLANALPKHQRNVRDIKYLWRYYKGAQPILARVKDVRSDINNKIVENHADEIVSFKVGYAFGEPITYAARAEDDCADAIAQLNDWNVENDKSAQDMDLATWMYVCGQGYKFVCPRSDVLSYEDEENETPYITEVIDPREAFVVYHNGIVKKPVLGVKIVKQTDETGALTYNLLCCYTETGYYEIAEDSLADLLTVPEVRPHSLRGIPIIEYPNNLARRGALEAVIPLLDAINNLQSNRMDGVEQFVQSLLLFHNVDVDAKDVRTHQHSQRVAEYSAMIAQEMNCFKWWERSRMLSNLRKAAQMHDIGKIGIPDNVLNKVGRLTDEEYAIMKSHVNRGSEILKDFTLVEHVVDGTRYHHERYDGRGYPDGLKGEEIPLFGRIIGVADAFDAMTSNRVYRNSMDTDYVMNEMKRGRGTQFDPEALDAFFRLVDKGIIDPDAIYAQKSAEIQHADQKAQEELRRRVEEDRKIQAAEMKGEQKAASPKESGETAADASAGKGA